jgi:endonuclease/exonuclease/phosphatase family metal-dependent hydrolase
LARGGTYPSFSPRIQFDHVLVDGLSPAVRSHARTMALEISDHCAVAVDLDGFDVSN